VRLAAVASFAVLAALLAAACGGVEQGLPPSQQEASAGSVGNPALTDAEVRQLIINDSIAAYDGNCPCPYNLAADGSICGNRSAYSKEGGAKPFCFPEDVSDAMVKSYRDEAPDS
jgi:hypothetical protein